MNQQILGIDISKDSFDVALFDGGHTYQGKFNNDHNRAEKTGQVAEETAGSATPCRHGSDEPLLGRSALIFLYRKQVPHKVRCSQSPS